MFPLSAPFCLARVSFLFPSGFPSGLPIADDSEVVSVDPVFELTRSGLFLDPGLGMFGYVGEIRERFIADHCHVLSLPSETMGANDTYTTKGQQKYNQYPDNVYYGRNR